MKPGHFMDFRGKLSSMRVAFLEVVRFCTYGAVPGCLILAGMDIIKNNGQNLLGVAAMIGAYAAFAFTAFRGKVDQLKTESKPEGKTDE